MMSLPKVLGELNRIKAAGLISEYAVGGAVAAQVYLEPASTLDVDVFVIFSGEGATSLSPLGPTWADLVKHGAVENGPYLVIGGWPVQLLPESTPLYDEAIRDALDLNVDGVVGRFMSAAHLAAIALATGREKDYSRVAEFLRSGAVTRSALDALVQRFGLTERWSIFATRYPSVNAAE